LVPHQGIRAGDLSVLLGAHRDDLRGRLAGHLPAPKSNRPNEDQYDGDGTILFLRFTSDELTSIMFVDGWLEYQGLQLHDTTFEVLEPALVERGFTVDDNPEYFVDGVDIAGLGVNIATADDVGGDGDDIEWVALWRPDPDSDDG
jgi:hypothetical protein